MTKEEIINNVIEEVNYDASKLSRKFVCEDAQIASLEEINAMFGSFGDFKIAALKAIADRATDAEAPRETGSGMEGVRFSPDAPAPEPEKKEAKVIYVTGQDGVTKKVKCPSDTTVKKILAALSIDTEEGYDIRINGQECKDPYAVPEDGARVTAMRNIKGNC